MFWEGVFNNLSLHHSVVFSFAYFFKTFYSPWCDCLCYLTYWFVFIVWLASICFTCSIDYSCTIAIKALYSITFYSTLFILWALWWIYFCKSTSRGPVGTFFSFIGARERCHCSFVCQRNVIFAFTISFHMIQYQWAGLWNNISWLIWETADNSRSISGTFQFHSHHRHIELSSNFPWF